MHPIFQQSVHQALQELTEDIPTLRVITILSKKFPVQVARQAAALHELRGRAAKRFPTMGLPFLTRKGLAQASSEVLARWRAARMAQAAPGATTYDMTCGVGADSIALGLAHMNTLSADMDMEHVQFARANLQHHQLPGHVILADAGLPAARTDLCLIDPDRRQEGKRLADPETWSPALSQALRVAASHAGACLKLAPALDPERLQAAEEACLPKDLPRRREWLSRKGELVEITLWTGLLATGKASERIATRLDGEGIEERIEGSPQRIAPLSDERAQAVKWIGDPDPALLRSGLLGNLAQEEGLAPLAAEIAYLGGQQRPSGRFLRLWQVLASSPLDRKHVRKMLGEHGVGPISVRKRGHSSTPEELERKFRGPGKDRGQLLIARLAGAHRAYLVEPCATNSEG